MLFLPFSHVERSELIVDYCTKIRAPVGLDDDSIAVRDEQCRIWTIEYISTTRFERDDVKRCIGRYRAEGNTFAEVC